MNSIHHRLRSLLLKCAALGLGLCSGLSHANNYYDIFSPTAISHNNISGPAAFDAAGNTYVIGNYDQAGGIFRVGPVQFSPIGQVDGYIAKLDISGNVIWARNFGGPNAQASASAVAVDSAGNVLVATNFSGGNLTIPSVAKWSTNKSSTDAVVMKLDTNGNWVWVRQYAGAQAQTSVNALKTDALGNLYVAGNFSSGNLMNPSLSLFGNSNELDGLVMKLDGNGNTIWAHNFGGASSFVACGGVGVDAAMNVVVAGVNLGGSMQIPTIPKLSSTGADLFAIKFDGSGNTIWARGFGGANSNAVTLGVAVASDGSVVLPFTFGRGPFTTPSLSLVQANDNFDAGLLKLNANGSPVWARTFGGNGPNGMAGATGIAMDSAGNIIFSGYYQGTAMTSPAIPLTGQQDSFIVELTSSGALTWGIHLGSTGIINTGGVSGNVSTDGTHSFMYTGRTMTAGTYVANSVVLRQSAP